MLGLLGAFFLSSSVCFLRICSGFVLYLEKLISVWARLYIMTKILLWHCSSRPLVWWRLPLEQYRDKWAFQVLWFFWQKVVSSQLQSLFGIWIFCSAQGPGVSISSLFSWSLQWRSFFRSTWVWLLAFRAIHLWTCTCLDLEWVCIFWLHRRGSSLVWLFYVWVCFSSAIANVLQSFWSDPHKPWQFGTPRFLSIYSLKSSFQRPAASGYAQTC